MTNEQLTAYLQDESHLYALGYEELKTLVMTYPYASNLRVLLLKKSHLDDHKDYDRNLQMAATYTTNRKHLYRSLRRLKRLNIVPQNVILGEDYLELTELSNIERFLGEKHVSEVFSAEKNANALVQDWQFTIDENSIQNAPDDEEPFDLTLPTVLPQNTEGVQNGFFNKDLTDIFSENEEEPIVYTGFDAEILALIDSQNAEKKNEAREIGAVEFDQFVADNAENSFPNQHDAEILAEEKYVNDLADAIVNEEIRQLSEADTTDEPLDFATDTATISFQIEEETTATTANMPPIFEIENEAPETYPEAIEEAKKTALELEIINEAKAIIVENVEAKAVISRSMSFTEWLQQYRMTSPNMAVLPMIQQKTKTSEFIDSQTIERETSRQNMDALMQVESELPEHLFGLIADPVFYFEDDDDDSDDIGTEGNDGAFVEPKTATELPKKKRKKKRVMHALAAKSLEADVDLVSETLADLLVWQKNFERAEEMYQQLITKFPEKSNYFAAKIEKMQDNNTPNL